MDHRISWYRHNLTRDFSNLTFQHCCHRRKVACYFDRSTCWLSECWRVRAAKNRYILSFTCFCSRAAATGSALSHAQAQQKELDYFVSAFCLVVPHLLQTTGGRQTSICLILNCVLDFGKSRLMTHS